MFRVLVACAGLRLAHGGELTTVGGEALLSGKAEILAEVTFDDGPVEAPRNGSTGLPASTPDVEAPGMPDAVRAFVYRDWSEFDGGIGSVLEQMRKMPAFMEFPHARNTFFNHLKGTYGMLMAWNQPVAVARAGLAHTAYSGDLFEFFIFSLGGA